MVISSRKMVIELGMGFAAVIASLWGFDCYLDEERLPKNMFDCQKKTFKKCEKSWICHHLGNLRSGAVQPRTTPINTTTLACWKLRFSDGATTVGIPSPDVRAAGSSLQLSLLWESADSITNPAGASQSWKRQGSWRPHFRGGPICFSLPDLNQMHQQTTHNMTGVFVRSCCHRHIPPFSTRSNPNMVWRHIE